MPAKLATSAVIFLFAVVCSMTTPVSIAEAVNKKVYQGGTVKTNKLPQTTALTSSDCRKVDGRVVEVADDRCGSSRQYCKLSNGNAVCIDKRD